MVLILETYTALHATPSDVDNKETKKKEEALEVLISTSFLILLILFMIIIVLGYARRA